MIDPALNQQVLGQIQTRVDALDRVIQNPSSSAAAKAEATAAKAQLTQEQTLRNRVANAKTDAERQRAERDLAAYRQRTCPSATDGQSVATCRPKVLYVHLHQRFLLPQSLLDDMRDAGKYPRRAAAVPADVFVNRYSFTGKPVPSKKRWSGDHPVVGATVRMAGKTATTNAVGTAKFEDVGAGTYTIEITPPPNQDTTTPAGPDTPVRNGFNYASAPDRKYRPFSATATVDAEGMWTETPAATVTLPHRGNTAAYAGVAGVTNMDLYLDWKPEWIKVANRHALRRTNQAVVMHATATTMHEQIGSPLDTFNGGAGTAAHYLVDLDGHIVKLVHESEVCYHAADSHWHELVGLNASGIGIETVHTDNNSDTDRRLREFPAEQYAAINRLVTLLRTTFNITKAYVCGHNDCRDGSRDCPGDMFDWASLENAGNALRTLYGGAFAGSRAVNRAAETADDAAVPLSQRLYRVGYTHKRIDAAVGRFIVRAWSGSRYDARPRGEQIVAAAAAPAPPRAPQQQRNRQQQQQQQQRAAGGSEITQPVADAIDQMFRDL